METGPFKIIDTRIKRQLIPEEFRTSVRGIIRKDNLVLMIYAAYYDDYTFPGGGIEESESNLVALAREMEEEAGVIITNPIFYYHTLEYRLREDNQKIMQYDSYFYLVDLKKQIKQKLEAYEVALGYKVAWIDINDAIAHNEAKRELLANNNCYPGVLDREIFILKKLLTTTL